MFYSYNLLSRKRGKFAVVWLAATRGEKFLTKKDICPIDLSATCNEIIRYVSCHQKDRLSLYLSAQLAIGICRVYRRKATYVLVELQELYAKSLRSFQPDLLVISLPKKSEQRGETKRKKEGDVSFTSRIDLHPTNAVPEMGEEFGQLVLPIGIEGRRGEPFPYVDEWVISQIPGTDSIIDISSHDKSDFRDPNQARPEDITMREDQVPAANLLEMSMITEPSIVVAAGGQGAEELQLPPMNLDFFEDRVPPIGASREGRSRQRPAPDADDLPPTKQQRLMSPDKPRRSQRIRKMVETTAVVHTEPSELKLVQQEQQQEQQQAQQQDQQQAQQQDQQQTQLQAQQQEQMQMQQSTSRGLYDIMELPRLEHELTAGDTSIRLFEDAQPSALPVVENILEDSLASTQTKVVKETPEDQQPQGAAALSVYDPPAPAPNATSGDILAITEASVTEQSSETRMPSSVERMLHHPDPTEEPPHRRRPVRRRRRRFDHLIVDEITALTREDIRAQLIANGRGLMREISFPPVRILPSADWLMNHAGNPQLGSALQRLWRERQILCSQAPPAHTKRRRLQRPEQVEDVIRPQDQSSLSEIERRRGGSGKNSMMQSVMGVSDVSIIPATASNSLLGDSALTSASHHQSALHAGSKTVEVVDEKAEHQQQEQQKQDQERQEQQQQEQLPAELQFEQQKQQQEQLPAELQIEQQKQKQQEQLPSELQIEQQQQQQQQQQEQRLLDEQEKNLQELSIQQVVEIEKLMQQQAPPELDSLQIQQQQQLLEQRSRQEREHQQQPKFERIFEEQDDVWRRLVSFEKKTVLWSELCSKESTSKKDAAIAFVAILEFAKKGLLQVQQEEPFGEIMIRLVTS